MSGSAGGNRISRAAVEKTVQDYIDKVLSKFPGFKDAKPTGSYNTGTKQDFGDIDLIVHLDSNDKKLAKQDLAKYFASLPDSVIVPFKSDKYKGKKSLSSGELVTVLYPIVGMSDEFVQIDNIISTSEEESTFKNTFLDYPAEVQGLLLGLAKVICLEEDPKKIFARLGITNVPELEANQEYEFNLSSAGLTLRIVTLDNFKELDRTEVWKSSNWSVVKKLFDNYNIDGDFKTLLQDLKSKLKNERSKNRIKGIFKSMVSIKSGEVDTPKGDNKQAALDAVSSLLENKLFKGLVKELILPLIEADSKKTVAIYGGGFKPPHKGHFEVVEKALEQFPQIDEFIIYVGSGTRDGITQAESLLTWDIYKKYLPLKVKVEPAKSPIRAIYEYIENHQDEDVIWVIGARDGKDDDFVDLASKTKGIGKYENVELAPIITQSDTSGTDARQALKKGQEAFLPFIPEKVKEKTEIFNTLSTVIQEIVTATEVICDNCGWEWDKKDGGKDLYICHKCGHDNNPALN
jgi:cytidyltransferase-like protein